MTEDSTNALRKLSITAGQMKPHKLSYLTGYEPNRDDIRDYHDEIITIVSMVDAYLEARGKELAAEGIISDVDARLYATRPCLNAIEGNLLYAIEDGIESRILEREDA